MRVVGADAVFSMNATTSTIDDRNEIKITLSDTKPPSMTADERGATTDDGKHRRRETVFWKIQFHHNNIVFLLVPLLLMILKETSALPPIIKIGEWQIFPISFQASCECCHTCIWINNPYLLCADATRLHNAPRIHCLHTYCTSVCKNTCWRCGLRVSS